MSGAYCTAGAAVPDSAERRPSPPPSTSSATSTSSTAPIVHRVAGLPQRGQGRARGAASVAALARDGHGHRAAGRRQDAGGEDRSRCSTPGRSRRSRSCGRSSPPGCIDMTRLPGLGPKRARRLFDELGIDSLDALREAAEAQRLRDVQGLRPEVRGERARGARRPAPAERRAPRVAARPRACRSASGIVEALRAHPASDRVELAGSARRLADSVKDLDIIATAERPGGAGRARFAELDVDRVRARRPGRRTPRARRTHNGHARSTCASSSPTSSATCSSTSPARRRTTWRCARPRCGAGLHVSEYGILDDATGETLRCATEEEVYARLGLAWIAPELREDRGELEAAAARAAARSSIAGRPARRPALHTAASDGANTIEEMARGARERGLRVHRDHRPLGDARLRQRRLRRRSCGAQIEAVREVDERARRDRAC